MMRLMIAQCSAMQPRCSATTFQSSAALTQQVDVLDCAMTTEHPSFRKIMCLHSRSNNGLPHSQDTAAS